MGPITVPARPPSGSPDVNRQQIRTNSAVLSRRLTFLEPSFHAADRLMDAFVGVGREKEGTKGGEAGRQERKGMEESDQNGGK